MRAELRTEARERRIEQISIEQSESENNVAHQRRQLDEIRAESTLKAEKISFKITQ